jgi:hypothetical protein
MYNRGKGDWRRPFFGSWPVAAHSRQHKEASETEGAHDFGGGLSSAQVGRVSPRPQDRGRSCTLFGRGPLRESEHWA